MARQTTDAKIMMNRLPTPTILDADAFRFPAVNHQNGQTMKEVWRYQNGEAVRVRMRDLKDGDLFYVRSSDPDDNVWMVADGDAWFYAPNQCWGVMGHPYDPNETEDLEPWRDSPSMS